MSDKIQALKEKMRKIKEESDKQDKLFDKHLNKLPQTRFETETDVEEAEDEDNDELDSE